MEGASQPAGRAYLRLVVLGALVGIPAGLVAALFLALVHDLEDWLWDDPTPAWYLIVGLPVVGAAIVAAARAWLPGDWGGLGAPGPAVPAAVLATAAAWLTASALDAHPRPGSPASAAPPSEPSGTARSQVTR